MNAVMDQEQVFMHGRSRSSMRGGAGGFSLMELMIAMTLGLLLLSGVVGVFMSSRTTYETTDRLSRIQESGRFALETLARDLRAAGYLGCSRRGEFTNTLNNPSGLLWNFAVAVQGFDGQGSVWKPALDSTVAPNAAPGSDALVVRIPRDDIEPVRVVEGELMTATTDPIVTEDSGATKRLDKGDVVQISDCNARAVFQVTANTAGTIQHGKVGRETDSKKHTESPGNDTDDLGYAYTDAAELLPVQSIVYYVHQEPGSKDSALWRRVSGSSTPEPLVEGVEKMQLRFGESVAGTIQYRRADEVANWQQVRTVRIALLVRSTSQYGTDIDHADYQLLDVTVKDPNDRHLRQIFTTTVVIRNATT